MDWDIVDGVQYYDDYQDEIYEFIFKIPDQSMDYELEVGFCYTPVYYDGTINGGELDEDTPSWDGLQFRLGAPYLSMDEMEAEDAYISAIFTYADADGDGCATRESMDALYEWGTQDAQTYAGYVDLFFGGDANEDDLMTWSEMNAWLPGVVNAGMPPAQADAIMAFF